MSAGKIKIRQSNEYMLPTKVADKQTNPLDTNERIYTEGNRGSISWLLSEKKTKK